MMYSVRVEERGSSYHTEIEAMSAEQAIRKLSGARKDAPTRFVFLPPKPSTTAGPSHRPRMATG